MSPKEKAKELVDKMTENFPFDYDIARGQAKQCAIICVDEILSTIPPTEVTHGIVPLETPNAPYTYWQSVKQEIQKL